MWRGGGGGGGTGGRAGVRCAARAATTGYGREGEGVSRASPPAPSALAPLSGRAHLMSPPASSCCTRTLIRQPPVILHPTPLAGQVAVLCAPLQPTFPPCPSPPRISLAHIPLRRTLPHPPTISSPPPTVQLVHGPVARHALLGPRLHQQVHVVLEAVGRLGACGWGGGGRARKGVDDRSRTGQLAKQVFASMFKRPRRWLLAGHHLPLPPPGPRCSSPYGPLPVLPVHRNTPFPLLHAPLHRTSGSTMLQPDRSRPSLDASAWGEGCGQRGR